MKQFRSQQFPKQYQPQSSSDSSSIQSIFELEYQYQLFLSKCQDTGEKPDYQKAKIFKQTFNKINSKKYPQVLNLYSMRLGVNTIMKLISILQNNKFKTINLSDNSISQYGMHAIKNLLNSTQIQSLNISSNMISQIGISLIFDELIKNNHLKVLDLGILEGSIRKNSFGIDGARCLASILLQNKTLQVLRLQDNDIGINGAQIISIPLKRNKIIKQLKISQNLIKTQGAQYILQNALHLQSLDLSKNFIKSSIGPTLEKHLQINKNLTKINLQFNQLQGQGCKILFEGVIESNLNEVNIRGNWLTDKGVRMIADVLAQHGQINDKLKHLNLSNNDITQQGVDSLITILSYLQLKSLNLSKNNLGDNGIISLVSKLKQQGIASTLTKLDISACKISEKAFVQLLQSLNQFQELQSLKCNDNYISEKYEKSYTDLLSKNKTLINLSLNGNRVSLSCMKVIKKIIERNLKEFQQLQPKKMKNEIYNMKQKQKKIKEAQQKLDKQKLQISKLQQNKTKLNDNLIKLQNQQKQKKAQFEDLIRQKIQQMNTLTLQTNDKVENLQKIKEEKQKNIDKLNQCLQKLRDKKQQLQYQLNIIRNEGQLLQEQFQKKNKMIS